MSHDCSFASDRSSFSSTFATVEARLKDEGQGLTLYFYKVIFTTVGKCNVRLPGIMLENEEDPCSGHTCDKCMVSGTDCGWCADPVSNSQLKIFNEKKIISNVRPGTGLRIQLNGTIPQSIRGKKTNLKMKIIGSKHRQLTHRMETDCRNMNQKKANLIICKRISIGGTISITLDLKLKSCLGAKHRSKLLLRVRAGNVKQTIHILVKDTCKCSCKSRKQKKRQRCVYNGKMAIGNCKCVATDLARLESPRLGAGEEFNANEDTKEYPKASDLVGCENCDVKKHCSAYGLCVDCLAFFNSPMPRRMCGPFCKRGFPLVTKVLGLPDHDNVCTYTDKDGCRIRYREIEDGIIEVGAVKECPKESPSCSNATCIGKNGGCNNLCDTLEPCVRCLEFRDYSQHKSARECQASCQQYSGRIQPVNFFSGILIVLFHIHTIYSFIITTCWVALGRDYSYLQEA
ncbi:hypothetical protein FSP39_013895 [Pinctada imbricata]|uniref:Uncharacterized protein n=1 Tax=Pinctada imbricata TaxID=66713 RepID=A0AA88XYS8_PINIB|nr:hypothetical protein FSP39_013895 [Pinctada imbricata]